jgi:hypothetical protein
MNPSTTTENGKGNAELSRQEGTRQLDGEIAALREELAGLVAELDRRRHELLDIKLQARRHALGMAVTSVALLATASGFVWLGAWRSRHRRTKVARIGRLREAISRMIDRPERVAAEPGMPARILTAAANAAVATAVKKILERGLHSALHRNEERPARLEAA